MAVSVKDVAAEASVSVGTVSNVLNRPEQVAPATAKRVQNAIDKLGFVRNDAARQLRAGRSRSIGLVVLDSANPFFAEVARGAEERAAKSRVSVLVGNSGQNAEREADYLRLFREQRVNGVLLTPTRLDEDLLRVIRQSGLPTVLVDAASADGEIASVSVDDVTGGRIAVQHLIEQGCRRIAFVGGPSSLDQIADRLKGAEQAVAGTQNVSLRVVETKALTVLHGRDAGLEIAATDPHLRPDGVFCANDLVAMGVLQGTAIISDLKVPDELAIVGYDDIDFASSSIVPITSVRQPAFKIGTTAVDLLNEALRDPQSPPRQVKFRPELVVRESSRPSASAAGRGNNGS
ncbi:LacI family DNA-binding transcriptional regulator [Microbacterium sp. NPDC089318]